MALPDNKVCSELQENGAKVLGEMTTLLRRFRGFGLTWVPIQTAYQIEMGKLCDDAAVAA
jgi:hypothetical protein